MSTAPPLSPSSFLNHSLPSSFRPMSIAPLISALIVRLPFYRVLFPGKSRLFQFFAVIRNKIKVRTACLRGVTLLALNKLHAVFRCFEPEHTDKNRMRKHHEIPVDSASHPHFLLSELVDINDQLARIMRRTVIDFHAAGLMQRVQNATAPSEAFDADVFIPLFDPKPGCLLIVVPMATAQSP